MPDQTIDAIKVKLELATGDIRRGVTEANKELDALGGKVRYVDIKVRPSFGDASAGMQKLQRYAKNGLNIPVTVGMKEEGRFGMAAVRTKIQQGLEKGGGILLPVRVDMKAAEAKRIRAEIRSQVGVVPIDFDWKAKSAPKHTGSVVVNWTWGKQPEAPPKYTGKAKIDWEWGNGPGGGPAGRRGGGGGGGGGGGPARPTPDGASGRTRTTADRAAHDAATASTRASRAEQRAEAQREQQARQQQQDQQQAATIGTATGTAGSGAVGRQTRAARSAANKAAWVAEQAKLRAAKAEEKAAKTVEQSVATAITGLGGRGSRGTPPPPAPTPVVGDPVAPTAGTAMAAPTAGRGQRAPANLDPITGARRVSLSTLRAGGGRASREHGFRQSGRPASPGKDPGYIAETPRMARTRMGRQRRENEDRERILRSEQLQGWVQGSVREMEDMGLSPYTPEDRKTYLRSLGDRDRKKLLAAWRTTMPNSKHDMPMDQISGQVMAMFLGSAQAQGEYFESAVAQTGGAIVNVTAGARRRGESVRKGGEARISNTPTKSRSGKSAGTAAPRTSKPRGTTIYVAGHDPIVLDPTEVSANAASARVAALDIRGPVPEVSGLAPNPDGSYTFDGKKFPNIRAVQEYKQRGIADEMASSVASERAASLEPNADGNFEWAGKQFNSREAVQRWIETHPETAFPKSSPPAKPRTPIERLGRKLQQNTVPRTLHGPTLHGAKRLRPTPSSGPDRVLGSSGPDISGKPLWWDDTGPRKPVEQAKIGIRENTPAEARRARLEKEALAATRSAEAYFAIPRDFIPGLASAKGVPVPKGRTEAERKRLTKKNAPAPIPAFERASDRLAREQAKEDRKAKGFAEGGLLAREGTGVAKDLTGRAEGGAWGPERIIEQQIIDFEKVRKYNDSKMGKGFTDGVIKKLRDKQSQIINAREGTGVAKDLTGRAEGGLFGIGGRGVLGKTVEMALPKPIQVGKDKGKVEVTGDATSPFWKIEPRNEAELEFHARLSDRWDPTHRWDPTLVDSLLTGAQFPFSDDADASTKPFSARSFPYPFSKNAEGGAWVKHGGLLDRMAQAGHRPDVTMVGERGPELAVTDPNTGQSEIVPTHKVSTWLARARDPQGMGATMLRGKDLTGQISGRAAGGAINFNRVGSGHFARRLTGPSSSLVSSAGVTPVYVTNWPIAMRAAGMVGDPAQATTASASIRGSIAAARTASETGPGAPPAIPRKDPPATPRKDKSKASTAAEEPVYGTGGSARMPAGPSIARGRLFARQLDLLEVQSKISEAKSLTPARAFTTSVAQITEQLTGRKGIHDRALEAQKLATQANAALTTETKVRSDLAAALFRKRALSQEDKKKGLTEEYAKELDKITEQLPVLKQRRVRAAHESELRAERAKTAAGEVLQPGDTLKTLASGFVGLTVATIAMQASFTALNNVMAAAGEGVSKWAAQMTGYVSYAGELGKTLGDAVRQQDGYTEAVVGSTLALSGMNEVTARKIAPAIESRAATVAGNEALQNRIELMAASDRYATNRPENLPFDFDANLVKSVGGLFDLGLGPGSTGSTAEKLSNYIKMQIATPGERVKYQHMTGKAPGGDAMGEDYVAPFDWLGGDKGARIGFAELSPSAKELQTRMELTSKALEYMNQQAMAFGVELKIIGDSVEAAEKTAAVFESIGDTHMAATFREKQLSLGGGNISEYQAAKWLQSQNVFVPTASELMQGMGRGLRSSSAQFQREAFQQRELHIPAAVAMQYIAKPMIPYGARTLPQGGPSAKYPTEQLLGGVPQAGQIFADQIKQYEAAYGRYGDKAKSAQAAITAEVDKGRKVLLDWGVPPEMISQIEVLGQDIQRIQKGLEQRSLNLTVAEYSNQIRLANRALSGAKDMYAAIKGDVRETLGGLQGQNFQLARQSQLLGFGMEQRQINFKLAMAGFTAPGDTPEQRQARIEQAKLEAEYSQKQLDIQKQMGSGQYKIGTIEITRSVADLAAQVNLLTEARSLAIASSAEQDALDPMIAQQEILIENAKTYSEVGQKNIQLLNQAATEIFTRTGEGFSVWGDQLVKTFRSAGIAFSDAIITGMSNTVIGMNRMGGGTWGGAADTGLPNHKATGPRRNAPGGMGSFATPTTFTVGEAGSETVAILRNPRQLSMPGSGGGVVNVNVNINGGGDIDEKKLASWGRQIQMNVEAALNRKTSLLGLRNP